MNRLLHFWSNRFMIIERGCSKSAVREISKDIPVMVHLDNGGEWDIIGLIGKYVV